MTSFVLILAGNQYSQWPAVIGGYTSREEAEEAGEEATKMTQVEHDRYIEAYHQDWKSYVVISGAASP